MQHISRQFHSYTGRIKEKNSKNENFNKGNLKAYVCNANGHKNLGQFIPWKYINEITSLYLLKEHQNKENCINAPARV